MALTSASACAKLILLGEHAVVYGYPAIAMPFTGLQMRAMLEPCILKPHGMQVRIPELKIDAPVESLHMDHPVRKAIDLTLQALEIDRYPSAILRVRSEIPFYSGLGTSAALAIVLIKTLSAFLGHPLEAEVVNTLAYEVEVGNHGTPSGIDNTVISYQKPLRYVKGEAPQLVMPVQTLTFLVGDTGLQKSTADTVAELGRRYQEDQKTIQVVLDRIGKAVEHGFEAIKAGDEKELGAAMNANQKELKALDLSCAELDHLIAAAISAGALGAKLSGGGRGGHMLALVPQASINNVQRALEQAGAKRVYKTQLEGCQPC